MRTVLDTSVLIGPRPDTLGNELAVSAITFAELHFGVLVAHDDAVRAERLRRLAVLEREFDPLPVDATVAAAYGRIAAETARAGRKPRARSMDLLIAATAAANHAALATRNAEDFTGLEKFITVVPV